MKSLRSYLYTIRKVSRYVVKCLCGGESEIWGIRGRPHYKWTVKAVEKLCKDRGAYTESRCCICGQETKNTEFLMLHIERKHSAQIVLTVMEVLREEGALPEDIYKYLLGELQSGRWRPHVYAGSTRKGKHLQAFLNGLKL